VALEWLVVAAEPTKHICAAGMERGVQVERAGALDVPEQQGPSTELAAKETATTRFNSMRGVRS
jgi:hypothetical protein